MLRRARRSRAACPPQKLQRRSAAGRDVRELVGDAGLLRGLDALAAADDGHGLRGREERASARVPRSKGGFSKTPIGTVPEDRPRRIEEPLELLERLAARRRAPSRPRGSCRSPTVFAPRAVVRRLRDDEVRGQRDRLAGFLAEVEDLARQRDLVLLEEGPADRQADRPHEVVRHAAADEQQVGAAREDAQRVDLAGDLGSAEDRGERALRLEQPRELPDLLLEQKARALLGDELRHADDRGVRAVRGAERVVDVDVGESGEGLRERRVVGLLAGVEAEVLEQQHFAGREGGRPRAPPRARRSRRRSGPAAAGARRTDGDGRERQLGLPLALGFPRCEAQMTRAPRSSASRTVGSVSTMRVSSATRPPSSGTLKSTRRKSLRP